MNIFGVQSHLYKKDWWRLHCIVLVFQVERETVMTAWRLHWGFRESGLLIECRVLKIMENGFIWYLISIASYAYILLCL